MRAANFALVTSEYKVIDEMIPISRFPSPQSSHRRECFWRSISLTYA